MRGCLDDGATGSNCRERETTKRMRKKNQYVSSVYQAFVKRLQIILHK